MTKGYTCAYSVNIHILYTAFNVIVASTHIEDPHRCNLGSQIWEIIQEFDDFCTKNASKTHHHSHPVLNSTQDLNVHIMNYSCIGNYLLRHMKLHFSPLKWVPYNN